MLWCFIEWFVLFNFSEMVIWLLYGFVEVMVYVVIVGLGCVLKSVCFDYQQLLVGQVKCVENGSEGVNLVSYGVFWVLIVWIVDFEIRMENFVGMVGEIWVQGDNVGLGYWCNLQQMEVMFCVWFVIFLFGILEGLWLWIGDFGVIFEGELFIMGCIKELLVVDGVNYYLEDIEVMIQEIIGGWVVVIVVFDDCIEKLVIIIEFMKWGCIDEEEKN